MSLPGAPRLPGRAAIAGRPRLAGAPRAVGARPGLGPVLFLVSGDGTLISRSKSGGFTAVPAGALRYAATDWPGRQAFYLEEGTINLLTNPSVEAAVGTDVRQLGGSTVTRDTGVALVGTASAKVVTPGSVSLEGIRFQSASSLGYTGSSRIFAPSVSVQGSGSLFARITVVYTDATFTEHTQTNFVASGSWQRITPAVLTINPAKIVNSINVDVRQQATAASTFYCDAAQIEEKDHATSFADGSLGTGYAWNGAANASASTRTAATITIPATPAPVSIAYRYSENYGSTWQFGYRLGVGVLGTNGLIAVSGSDLVVSTSRSLQIGPIAGFSRALTAPEQARLAATDPANWWGAIT